MPIDKNGLGGSTCWGKAEAGATGGVQRGVGERGTHVSMPHLLALQASIGGWRGGRLVGEGSSRKWFARTLSLRQGM